MSVKVFGELEFWFSFFKVATIIIMIVAGFGIIIWGIGNGGQPTGIHKDVYKRQFDELDTGAAR